MTSQTREPLPRTAAELRAEKEFLALYGPWAALTPQQVAQELAGFDRPWWVVGGWAIEAATGYRREHEDTDISVLACDVGAFVEFMADRWHVWSNVGGVFRPLGEGRAPVDDPTSQLWLRRNATSPWVLDVPLTPDRGGSWTNKRLPGHCREVEDVTWSADDGIRYLLPEIVLVYKATARRPKDRLDLEATLAVLTPERRAWLRDAVVELDAGHPWLSRLARD